MGGRKQEAQWWCAAVLLLCFSQALQNKKALSTEAIWHSYQQQQQHEWRRDRREGFRGSPHQPLPFFTQWWRRRILLQSCLAIMWPIATLFSLTYSSSSAEMVCGWSQVMELSRWVVLGSIIGFVGAALGSIGGVGGGGIFVPMLTLIIGFDPKTSTAISKCKSTSMQMNNNFNLLSVVKRNSELSCELH